MGSSLCRGCLADTGLFCVLKLGSGDDLWKQISVIESLPSSLPAPCRKSSCQFFSQPLSTLQAQVPCETFPFPGVTGSLKGTSELLVASGTLWKPCQFKPCLAHLRAKSRHPVAPRVTGQGRRGAESQTPSATGPRPVPSNPLAISCAPFQDTQPAKSGG